EVEDGRDRDLDTSPSDAHAVVRPRARFAVEGHVQGLGEPRLDAPDLSPTDRLLVAPERLAGERVVELLSLAEDQQLLARLRAAALPEVEVERVALHTHDEPFERLERAHELLGDQHEGRAHAVGEPRARRAPPRPRCARPRATYSASARPTARSTWKRVVGAGSSATYSLTPTTMPARAPTARQYRYAAPSISRCMNGIAAIAPPSSSI